MRARRPDAKIARIPTCDFIDRLIEAIRRDRMEAFRESVASLDAMLLDDVRLPEDRRASTKEILFNLDEVLNRGGQVVVTCDVAPRRYPPLARWLSAKGGGMAAALRGFTSSSRRTSFPLLPYTRSSAGA